MDKLRNGVIWCVAIAIVFTTYWMSQDEPKQVETETISLPENPPDVYITGMFLTQYNELGIATMTIKSDAASVYNDTATSHLTNPIVTFIQDGVETWRISSQEATVIGDETISFDKNITTLQLTEAVPFILTTDHMLVNQTDLTVTTPLPVTIIRGQQVLNGIGMTIHLESDEPKIELHSEVSFSYDPS